MSYTYKGYIVVVGIEYWPIVGHYNLPVFTFVINCCSILCYITIMHVFTAFGIIDDDDDNYQSISL